MLHQSEVCALEVKHAVRKSDKRMENANEIPDDNGSKFTLNTI
jgi:hypothetical protein